MTGAREIHVSAAVIVDGDDRVLFVRKNGTEVYMQPGGKPERGESAAEALARELREELGLRLDPATLRPLGSFSAAAANEPGHIVIAEVFAVDEVAGLEPVIGAEIAELRWIARDEASTLSLAPLSRDHLLPLIWG